MKETAYNAKIDEIENKLNDYNRDKYIATPNLISLQQKFCCKASTSKFNNKGRF